MQALTKEEAQRLEEMLESMDPTIITLAGAIILNNYYDREYKNIFEKVRAKATLEKWSGERQQALDQIGFAYLTRELETQLMWGRPK